MTAGRPSHKPTDELRAQVETMLSVGITQEQVAAYIGICVDTLVKHYADEIRKGSMNANVAVAKSLYKNAIKGNVSAQIFWCKTRLGWREKVDVDHSGSISITSNVFEIKPKS